MREGKDLNLQLWKYHTNDGLMSPFFSIHLEDGVQNELAEGAGKLLAVGTGGGLTELAGFWVKISACQDKLLQNITALK